MEQTDLLRFTISALERLSIRYAIGDILRVSGEMVDREYVARFAYGLQVADVWNAILRRLASVERGM